MKYVQSGWGRRRAVERFTNAPVGALHPSLRMMVDDEYLPVPIPVAAPALVDAPESSMLVEFGGKRLSGELRRSHGWPLRYR